MQTTTMETTVTSDVETGKAPQQADFDLDLTAIPAGENPDVNRIFASDTAEPCQCSSTACH